MRISREGNVQGFYQLSSAAIFSVNLSYAVHSELIFFLFLSPEISTSYALDIFH